MKALIVISLLVVPMSFKINADFICPQKYIFKSSVESNKCASTGSKTELSLTYGKCSDGYRCKMDKLIESLVPGGFQQNKDGSCKKVKVRPGGNCKSNDECRFGKCTDGKCPGFKSQGDACEVDGQKSNCKSDLYCENYKCVTKESTGKKCSDDKKCAVGTICVLEEKICKEPFTLEVNSFTQDSRMCKSGFAVNKLCQNFKEIKTVDCIDDTDCKDAIVYGDNLTTDGKCYCVTKNDTSSGKCLINNDYILTGTQEEINAYKQGLEDSDYIYKQYEYLLNNAEPYKEADSNLKSFIIETLNEFL